MELGTFGAVMGYATEIVRQSAEYYTSACSRAQSAQLKEILTALRDGAEKDRATLEQTRRENVTEMILEPIVGLLQEDYETIQEDPVRGTDTDIAKRAFLLEDRDRRFFQDSSAKLPLPEVARTFRRLAKRREGNLARIRMLIE